MRLERVGGDWPDSEFCSVRITTIEEPIAELPGMHLWTRSVSSWELLPDDGFPQFEMRPG